MLNGEDVVETGRAERPSVFCAALTIVNDDEVEGLESFSVEFTDSESGLSTECQVDIIDNDNPGALQHNIY